MFLYGENVLEAIKKSDWICPVCRSICNCSLCRLKKGWKPTGTLYNKIQISGTLSDPITRRKPASSKSEIKAAKSDNTQAAKENEPEIIISYESIIVVKRDESSGINDGETMAKRRCQVKRKKREGHTGNLSPSPDPIASRLRRRLFVQA
ncbi:Cell division cycle-associated 7-like protein [Carex littledalei]|uniref:Cell division cycle-associated 7-like protein n=1 Tax=Carex littledalei TaxID=544730 RepID=A0A833RSP8_9POAL|nr:Cell division cycle-associated 7-like protein [Carex littledalei]